MLMQKAGFTLRIPRHCCSKHQDKEITENNVKTKQTKLFLLGSIHPPCRHIGLHGKSSGNKAPMHPSEHHYHFPLAGRENQAKMGHTDQEALYS